MYVERLEKMLDKIKNIDESKKEMFLKLVESQMKCFPDYVNAVVLMEQQIRTARIRYSDSPEEFQEKVSSLDGQRKNSHLALIDAINITNRLCKQLNIKPFFSTVINMNGNNIILGVDKEFEYSPDCRELVAACAKDFVDELYFLGQQKTYQKDKSIDKDVIHKLSQSREVQTYGYNTYSAQKILESDEAGFVPESNGMTHFDDLLK